MGLRHRCSNCNAVVVWITRDGQPQQACINPNCTAGHQPEEKQAA